MSELDTIAAGLRAGQYIPCGGAKAWAAADDRRWTGRTVGMSAVRFFPRSGSGPVFVAVFEFAWVGGKMPSTAVADECWLAAVIAAGEVLWRLGTEDAAAKAVHAALWAQADAWHPGAVKAAAEIAQLSFGETP